MHQQLFDYESFYVVLIEIQEIEDFDGKIAQLKNMDLLFNKIENLILT